MSISNWKVIQSKLFDISRNTFDRGTFRKELHHLLMPENIDQVSYYPNTIFESNSRNRSRHNTFHWNLGVIHRTEIWEHRNQALLLRYRKLFSDLG